MKLSYLPVNFRVKFISPVRVDNNPLFVLRSVLGKQLKTLCCVSPHTVCKTCMYTKACVYACVFESIVDKKNEALPGRNTISHPYCVAQGNYTFEKDNVLSEMGFVLTLFGDKAIEYLPYFYGAFVRAGKEGLFKERIPFEILSIKVNGESLLVNQDTLRTDFTIPTFDLLQEDNLDSKNNKEILIELKTPLRFKVNGNYSKYFSARDFWNCLYRRAKTMFIAYGIDSYNEDFPILSETGTNIIEKNLYWNNIKHYSARQKNEMELGGVVGTIKLNGPLSNLEKNLLEFARIANAGKNTNFGLGQIDYWMR